jgi:large repetitive protein
MKFISKQSFIFLIALLLGSCDAIKKKSVWFPIPSNKNTNLTSTIAIPPGGIPGTNDSANEIPAPIGATLVVSQRTGLATSENGTTANVNIHLSVAPTSDVIINLVSSNINEVTISPAQLTFTSSNWNIDQVVTLTGVDDILPDGNQAVSIDLGMALSADINYSNIACGTLDVINSDNDFSGITVTPLSGLTVSENGTTSSFTVVLNTAPTANVTFPIISNDTTEGIVSTASIIFTPANWSTPQTVTITGVDDFLKDGNNLFTVDVLASTSADPTYNGLSQPNISITNQDNDTADFTIVNSTLTTSENGTTGIFYVVLTSQPTAAVVLPLINNNPAEGSLSVSSLTFTTSSWNITQAVTVTGVNDSFLDGNISYTIGVGAPTSTDTNYSSLPPKTVNVTNNDNDSPAFDITLASGHTSEDLTTAFFRVRLVTIPTANVTISFNTSNAAEGIITGASSLTFTALNWNVYQNITVRGVNDSASDGDKAFSIVSNAASSTDSNYNGLDPADISFINDDNDTPGYTVAFSGLEPLNTNESGSQIRFTVKLRTRPASNVTFTSIASNNLLAGTVSPANLTFTNSNWSVPQIVTVTGVNNNFVNPTGLPYTVTIPSPTSADLSYVGLSNRVLNFMNGDNDSKGYIISKTKNFITSELGTTDSFTIRLNSQPVGGDVVIPLTSSNPAETAISPASLTFTALDWNTPKTVTLTGVPDGTPDGTQSVNILLGTASAGSGFKDYFPNLTGSDYDSIKFTDLNGAVANNGIFTLNNCDANAAISVCMPLAADRVTSESSGSFQYYLILSQSPTGNVTIPVSVSDPLEGSVSTTSIVKNSSNWNTVQWITVTGLNDLALDISGTQVDGTKLFDVVHGVATSSDLFFNGFNPVDITGIPNADNDTPNIIFTPASTTGSRIVLIDGASMALSMRLNAAPIADVSYSLSGTGFTVTPSPTITFTAANWNTIQVVNVAHSGTLGSKTLTSTNFASTDPKFSGKATNDVFYSIVQAGFTVSAISGDTDETGTSRSFTVRLNAPPTANVTINLSSLNTSEVIITSASTLTFTPANWNTNQTVTVQGIDDGILDGDQTVVIDLQPASSGDASYNALDPANVNVLNIDND